MSLERWGWYSIAISLLLAALHGSVAVVSSSLAVTAELLHNLGDLVTAVAVLIGLKLAARISSTFPYGLYKVENMVAAGLASTIFIAAYRVGRETLFAPPLPVRVDPWMLAVLVVSTAIPLVFGHFELRAARAANSPALEADAREYRVHVATTGLAFASLLSHKVAFPLDRVAALIIVVVVVRTGWNLLADALRALLDASLDPDTMLAIRTVIDADPAVAELKWATGRNAGRFRFVEAGVALRVTGADKAETVAARIEATVRRAVPYVERILVHVEVPLSPYVRYAVPLANPGGEVSRHFGEAPYFALLTVRRADRSVEERRVLPNPHAAADRAKGIQVAEWLVANKADVVFTREELRGRGPVYVLRDAGVELRRTACATISDVLAAT